MKRHWPLLVMLVCATAFAFGLVELFELRFEVGDVYPAYSSLRSDPLGTMALYESLGKLPELSVRRDFSSNNRMPEEPRTVYLHLAASQYDWDWMPKDLFHEIDTYLVRGNRLVITFFPQTGTNWSRSDDESETNSVKATPEDKKMTPPKPSRKKHKTEDEWGVEVDERWGFHTDFRGLDQNGDVYAPARVFNRSSLPLPKALDWHSGIVFTNLDPAWHVIYARGTNAVVIERFFGKGSVVMATDSYLLSNEAMAQDRHADLLAWLVGANRNVVFDEAHLGVVETTGVAGLMRRYRLHGLIAGLVLLAGLFIWKNSVSLVPPLSGFQPPDHVAGKDAASGFVNLLRRSIAPRDLLKICLAEWKKTAGAAAGPVAVRAQQATAIVESEMALPPHRRQPVETYRALCSLLANRKHQTKS